MFGPPDATIDGPIDVRTTALDGLATGLDVAIASEVRARARGAVTGQPDAALVRMRSVEVFGDPLAADAVVCVPARDEEARLPACLATIAVAISNAPAERCAVVVLVNNARDGSADVVRRWAVQAGVPTVLCVATLLKNAANVAVARRCALDIAEAIARPDAVLLSTDADTRLPVSWVGALAAPIRAGADLAAGEIAGDPDELAVLPARVDRVGRVERRLLASLGGLWACLGPAGPSPLLLGAAGANLAISAPAYRAVGRLPTDAANEDRALLEAVLLAGRPVVEVDGVTAITSCRLDARAKNGVADALRQRCILPDPAVDPRILTVRTFVRAAVAFRLLAGCAATLGEEWHALAASLAVRFGASPDRVFGRADLVPFRAVRELLSARGPQRPLTQSAAVREQRVAAHLMPALGSLDVTSPHGLRDVLALTDALDG